MSAPPDAPKPPRTEESETLSAKYVLDIYDALTHCTEPKGHHQYIDYLETAVKAEEAGAPIPEFTTGGADHPDEQHDHEHSKEGTDLQVVETVPENWDFLSGLYTIDGFDKRGLPKPHRSWKPGFQLVLTKEDPSEGEDEPTYYFQVFRSEDEAETVLEHEAHLRAVRTPEWKNDHLVYHFAAKYLMGRKALDENGRYKVDPYMPPPDHFNFAEHAHVGDNLTLRWSEDSTSPGSQALTLKNGVRVSYGQINALGGDFYGTADPICLGKDFDDQCARFMKAYETLATNNVAVTEVPLIIGNRSDETQMFDDLLKKGGSSSEGFRKLEKPGEVGIPGIGKDEEDLTPITGNRGGGPGYLGLSQLNLDHFGADGRTAYNAGHTCALRAAAAGDLQTAYAMNAFADHFLGDAFASGHLRTPRRKLHGDAAVAAKAVSNIVNAIRKKSKWSIGISILSDSAALAPDACSKFMHDEDNSKGLLVGNARDEQWRAYGDKRLLDDKNVNNAKMMKKSLQASIDEVYAAFKARTVGPAPEQFAAWQIAPTKVLPGNHSPLFNAEGHYRDPIDDPTSTKYVNPADNWFYGYRYLAKDMSESNYFKNL